MKISKWKAYWPPEGVSRAGDKGMIRGGRRFGKISVNKPALFQPGSERRRSSARSATSAKFFVAELEPMKTSRMKLPHFSTPLKIGFVGIGRWWPRVATALLLSLLASGAEVMVSWPSADTAGFALEQAGTLAAPASWVTSTASVTDDGTNKSVTISATNSSHFFRLRRP